MDNLTHSLFGLVLARAGLGRGERWAAPLLVVAANAPDFESLIPARSTAEYLLHHRGVSHGILGVCVEAVLLTFATLLIVQWRRIPSAAQPVHVFAVAFIGVSSHIFLDWLNTYGVHPWQPFSDTVYYGDLAFIIDPWFWLLLWAGCFLSAPMDRKSHWIYGGIGIVMAAVLFWGQSMGLPAKAVGIWLSFAGGVVLLRVRRGVPMPGAGKWALAGVSLYLGLLLGFSRTAVQLVRSERPNVREELFSAHPAPGVPWRYTVMVDRGARVEQFAVSALRGQVALAATYDTLRDDPRLELVRDTQEFRAWRYFARHPLVRFEDGAAVFSDARYRFGARGDWTEMRVPLPKTATLP